MRLEIVNFKSFTNKNIDFESRCTLISGESGSGKTSILAAINFALTGEGRKVIKFGSSKCSVRLVLPEMSMEIMRSKGPCRLLVKHETQTFEDASAQSMIDSVLANWELGYVSQRIYKSFVTMTPSDKLAMIEKMAFDKIDMNEIHSRCRELVAKRKENVESLKREISSLENVLKDIGCVEISHHLDVDEMKRNLYEIICERNKKTRSIDIMQTKLNEYKRIKTKSIEIDKVLETISRVDQYDIDQLSLHTTRYERYLNEKKRLRCDVEYSGMSQSDIDATIDDMLRLKDIENEMKKLSNVRKELWSAEEFKKTHIINLGQCPSCGIDIGMWNGNLSIRSSSDVHDTTKEESERCEEKRIRLQTLVERLSELESKRDEIVKSYIDDDDESFDVDYQLSYYRLIKNNDEIWRRCKELECEKPEGNLQKAIECMKERTLLEKEKRSNDFYLQTMCVSESDIEREKNEEYILLQRERQIEEDVKNFEISKQWSKVRELKKRLLDAESRFPISVQFQNLVKKAEKMVLDDLIKNINVRASLYLSRFFRDDIKVELVFDQKQKIEMNIVLDGNDTDVNSLSGGEFARVVLAFALAMIEMNNVNLLMLDESFASLDSDTAENVLDVIKENFKGKKIIVVAHQTTKGIFDEIIEI